MTLDSRARKPRGVKPYARHLGVILHIEPVYCVSCHHQSGYTTFGVDRKDGPMIFLCGQEDGCGCNCEGRFGTPPEMMTKVPDPDEFVRTRNGLV